ncbi:hypothetical protein HOI18_04350 [Candidatus Uhrbacteria bacterium]|nr:hypothetical protein [Candidatus Uhrbacteria bacterium]
MTNVDYPYMPEGRELKFVSVEDSFMQEAAKARGERAGDPLWPIGAVLVKDGEVVATAGNGFDKGAGRVHVCPRIVEECASGVGYELCDLHNAAGHAEPMVIKVARDAGVETEGADFYMYGHWWCCEPCWNVLIDAGVRDVYVVDDAHERFSRDRVYAETLKSTVKSAYIAGPITNVVDFESQKKFYEAIGEVCESMGCKARIPHRDNVVNEIFDGGNCEQVYEWATNEAHVNDVVVAEVSDPSLGTGGELVEAVYAKRPIVLLSKVGSKVSRFVLGNPAVVYHIEYENQEDVCRKLKNVLKQL